MIEEVGRDRYRNNRSSALKLEKSDDVYQLLVDAIDAVPEGIALLDAEDRYVMWNRRYAEVYGPIVETIAVGARFEDTVRAALEKGLFLDAVGREEKWLADRLAKHRQASHTHEHHMSGGKWIRAEERLTANGGRVCVRTDITELKQRQASFRLLFESNPIPMFVCAADTLAFLAVNAAAVRHYGFDKKQFSNMSVFDLRRRDDVEDLHQRTRANDVGQQNGEIRRHVKADGGQIDVAVYSTSMTFNDQPAVIVAAIDVTGRLRAEAEQREAEAKLSEQKLRLDTAIENMTQGLVMFDANDRLVIWNHRYVELYGLSLDVVKVGCLSDDLMKHRMELGVFSENPNEHARIRNAHLAEGKPWIRVNTLRDATYALPRSN